MDVHLSIYIIVFACLLLLSSFFSSTETAFTIVNRLKLEAIIKEDEAAAKQAQRVIAIIDDMPKFLSTILVGNNLVNILASSLATVISIELFSSMAVGLATGVTTFFVLIFGEIMPKSFATMDSTNHCMRVSGIVSFLMWICTPVVFILNLIVSLLLKIFGISQNENDGKMTSEELLAAIDISHESGAIEETQKEYIENIFDFQSSMVREIMTPRIDITVVNKDWSYDKLMSVFQENMYTRYPVYEKNPDKICGILNMKDLLLYDGKEAFFISNYIREAYFTYEQKNTSKLFGEMRQNSVSMAIVLDEYGDLAGLITLEDLIEELVGEIRDEFDGYEVDDVTPISDREFDVLGSANLDDICDELDLKFTSDDYDTIGGYLVGLFDHFPKAGEVFVTEEGISLRVLTVSKNRIGKIRIILPEILT